MAKLFLGSKTLYYDVHPFLFYVMTESDEYGMHFVGYFSKEKREGSQNNVSCILTLPIHQRKGYGNLLIDFSYLLTRAEGKTGSPEKPFSDLGLVSYRNYWKLKLCYLLRDQHDPLTIGDISFRTGMNTDDIICGLEALQALVRDPVTGTYALRLDYALFESQIERWEAKGYIKLNPPALLWTPYLMGRSQAEALDNNPTSTIAPRPGDEPNTTKDPLLVSHPSEHSSRATSQVTQDKVSRESSHTTPQPPAHDLNLDFTNTPARKLFPRTAQKLPVDIAAIPPSRFELVPPPPGTQTTGRYKRPGASVLKSARKRSQGSPASYKSPRVNPGKDVPRRKTKLQEVTAGEVDGGGADGRGAGGSGGKGNVRFMEADADGDMVMRM